MASSFNLKGPFLLAALPRPVDNSAGRYATAEVLGGLPGSRKRKRAELAVGIDGEGLNLYDTQYSRLITSYAVSPQSTFTCSPCSLRWKDISKHRVERRTYLSIHDSNAEIVLFRDSTKVDGTTETTKCVCKLSGSKKPVVFIGIASRRQDPDADDVVIVKEDGEIQYLDGEELHVKWTSPASTMTASTEISHIVNHRAEFVTQIDAFTASKGLLKSHQDVFTAFSEPISQDEFNPSLLVIISSPRDSSLAAIRTLHVVALPQRTGQQLSSKTQSVQVLLAVPIPWLHRKDRSLIGDIRYDLHASSGSLYELAGSELIISDLTDSLPKMKSQIKTEQTTSFLRLTNASTLMASAQALDVYNPKFHSLQASLPLDNLEKTTSTQQKQDSTNERSQEKSKTTSLRLITYSSKQGLVFAISGHELIAFQVEGRQEGLHKRHELGLLIDSLGCGVPRSKEGPGNWPEKIPLKSFGDFVPGTQAGKEKHRKQKIAELDRCAAAQDIEGFERIIAKEVGISRDESELKQWEKKNGKKSLPNGTSHDINEDTNEIQEDKPVPAWLWLDRPSNYPDYDPRWAQYVLSKIFTLRTYASAESTQDSSSDAETELLIDFFPHNVVNWLIETGNMNKANLQSALRQNTPSHGNRNVPAGLLVGALVDVDPEMRLLYSLLSNTFLDAAELVHSIRVLMQSLALFGEGAFEETLMLTNGESPDVPDNNVEAEIELAEEEAETALQLAEFHLKDDSGLRAQALSLALAKLHTCPSPSIISALQTTLSSNELTSLVYLLRFELARGAWTSRYFDTNQVDGLADDSTTSVTQQQQQQDNSTIILIASLLNTCIDAIGSSGWLSGDTVPINGDHFESEELITSLKLEVSAALEGIQEATFLKGITAEMLRYAATAQRAAPPASTSIQPLPGDKKRKRGGAASKKPVTLPQDDKDASLLPLGLKAGQRISKLKIGAGGELSERTARDIGHLTSKRVGKYTRESIVI